MRFIPIIVLILVSVSFSDTATQTDWSGGGGVLGPVADWGNSYDVATQIDNTESSLQLTFGLLTTPVKHTVEDDYFSVSSIYAADVDGDGDTDVLGACKNANDITWWENSDTGSGIYWTKHTVDGDFTFANSVHAADVDGDGDTDVLGTSNGLDDITWWENTDGTGTSWTEHTVDGDFDYACSVYAADVDGDNDTDVLGAASNANDITWWENTDSAGTSWTEHTVDGDFNYACSVYATDVDGDGDIDVLGAASNASDITWWENMDGSGTSWTEHLVDGDFGYASSVYATDVDGDGDTDVLGAAYDAGRIAWWENIDGTGTSWTEHPVDQYFDGAESVYAEDIDGDGDTDIVGAASEGPGEITWWENANGTGTSWTEHKLYTPFDDANSVYATDIDGDGDTEILGAAYSASEIAWWDVIGFSAAGALESSILDAGTVSEWELFVSNEQEPTGTSIGFQFRSSDDFTSMGMWSDTVFAANTDLSSLLADLTGFVQYKAILETTDPSNTPVLNDVTISYTTDMSIGETSTSWDLAPFTNPLFGSIAVRVSVPQSAMVDLLLYDVAGRLIAQQSHELPGGEHSVSFNNLAEGVYFCTMRAEDFTATEQIVVLK